MSCIFPIEPAGRLERLWKECALPVPIVNVELHENMEFAFALADRWSSGGPAEERHGIFASATRGDGAGSDTRNLRGVMPNSPPNSLDLLTFQHFFPGLAGGANSALHRRGK